METASLQFIAFGLAVALVSNLRQSVAWRSTTLMLASIAFLSFATHKVLSLLPIIGFLLLGYLGLALIERTRSRYTAWSVVSIVFAYIWLKKYTFLPGNTFLHFPFLTLGLSYIFFRVLHLLIEAGDRQEKRHVAFGAYLLYMLNFTTLISGPIQLYDDFVKDQFARRPLSLGQRAIWSQLERILRGFFKVNVLGALLDMWHKKEVSQIYSPLLASSRPSSVFWLMVIYPFFLYANFSGYIDIVIALARLMRERLPENFDRPFSAPSFLEFWSRWHITLSNWFKIYVYNPLLVALMRRIPAVSLEPLLGVFCFFVTFFLVGIWHGRTSEFAMYGVLQGGGISVNKLWQLGLARAMGRRAYKALARNPAYIAFSRGLTFSWFAFTLSWLWASWAQLHAIVSAISVRDWLCVWLAVWLCATAVLALWEWLRSALFSINISGSLLVTNRFALVVYASALGFVTFIVTNLLNQPAPDIVYKAF
jgi:D-alanyl-lipoteichoic acid acyltransferase DltB (MBOAT superfamily)